MKILLDPRPEQIARLSPPPGTLPRWFAAPIAAAVDKLEIGRNPRDVLFCLIGKKAASSALVFNVDLLEAVVSALPFRKTALISLHQWWPPELLPTWKHAIYQNVLRNSRIILSYSAADTGSLRRRFPGADVRWIGHFVDTDFFTPSNASSTNDRYILCPGDHRRLEHVVVAVAEEVGVKVVRFSTDPQVLDYHRTHPSRFVECCANISFAEVLDLYRHSVLVLNAVDDRHWPVGITTFCEALATDRPVITSAGHSCSGYTFEDGSRPYITVDDLFNASAWIEKVREALNSPFLWPEGRSPRDLALSICSYETMVAAWRIIIRDAEAQEI